MKNKTLINEVRQLQKIAGLLKEDYRDKIDNLTIIQRCIELGDSNPSWSGLKKAAIKAYEDYKVHRDDSELDDAVENILDEHQPPKSVIPYETRGDDRGMLGSGLGENDTIDLSDTPRFGIGVGSEVYIHLEGEQPTVGEVTDTARNWDEVLQKGGKNIKEWEALFNDKEYADSVGYDSMEEWEADFVHRCKKDRWFEIDSGEENYATAANPDGWYPAEYVKLAK